MDVDGFLYPCCTIEEEDTPRFYAHLGHTDMLTLRS